MLLHTELSTTLPALVHLLTDQQFHSDTELARRLHVPRHTVWEIIQRLQAYQIPIEVHQTKGYRLTQPLELLDAAQLSEFLELWQPRSLTKHRMIILESTPSTNLYLQEQRDPATIICLAEQQTAGRGRHGHLWYSPFGVNLYLSYQQRFHLPIQEISSLSLVVGLALIHALQTYGIAQPLALKWPNDILHAGQKLAGILIDVTTETQNEIETIIGIGLNVNMENYEQENLSWTSLYRMTHTYHNRNYLAAIIIHHLAQYISQFQTHSFCPFLSQWQRYDCLTGKIITLNSAHQTITGTVEGITEQGYLRLRSSDGTSHIYSAGEVTIGSQTIQSQR